MNDSLIAAFLDYWNNYLTVDRWAEDNGMKPGHALDVLAIGKELHNERCVDA